MSINPQPTDVRMSEVLERVLELWESSENWVQGTDGVKMVSDMVLPSQEFVKSFLKSENVPAVLEAIERMGTRKPQACAPHDPQASKWCSQGAISKAIYDLTGQSPQHSMANETVAVLFARTMQYVSDQISEEWFDEMFAKWKEQHVLHQCVACHHGEMCVQARELELNRPKSIVGFNDDKRTTFEDVRLLFKQALHSLEA